MGDGDDPDTVGSGDGDAIRVAIPPKPCFIDRFSNRFIQILNDENANFTEFSSIADDFTACIKQELNFKIRPDDGAVCPAKQIDLKKPTEIEKIISQKQKNAPRLICNEESEFCDLDPEEVAGHYNTILSDKPQTPNL